MFSNTIENEQIMAMADWFEGVASKMQYIFETELMVQPPLFVLTLEPLLDADDAPGTNSLSSGKLWA